MNSLSSTSCVQLHVLCGTAISSVLPRCCPKAGGVTTAKPSLHQRRQRMTRSIVFTILALSLLMTACRKPPKTVDDAGPQPTADASPPAPVFDAGRPPQLPDASGPPAVEDASVGDCTTSSCRPGSLPCCAGTRCFDVTRTDTPDLQCCVSAEKRLVRGVCAPVCWRSGQPEPSFPLCGQDAAP